MKCQILISWKNKTNIINLPSAESAHSMISVKAISKFVAYNILKSILLFVLQNMSPDIPCDLSGRQTIHMECCFIFSEK